MPSDDWSFDKRGYFLINLFVGSIVFYLVPLNFAHFTETLLLIERSWLVVYSMMHGLVFAVLLEVFGRYEIDAILQKLTISLYPALRQFFSATFLNIVNLVNHYSFIGRYVVLYVVFGSSYMFFTVFILSKIDTTLKNTQVLLLVEDSSAEKIELKQRI